MAQPEGDACLLDESAEESVVFEDITRLMITVLAVLVHHLLGIAGVAADEVASRVQEDRRHAAAGKVELVAPEEEALVGLDIRRDGHVLFPGGVRSDGRRAGMRGT